MKITLNKINGNFDGKECYVHARATALNEKSLFMTLQKLRVEGSDTFLPLEYLKSDDGGITWTKPVPLVKADKFSDRISLLCDATPYYHRKTAQILIVGIYVSYSHDYSKAFDDEKREICYYTFNPETEKVSELKRLKTPACEFPEGVFSGCGQIAENEEGEIYIPATTFLKERGLGESFFIKCTFDGEELNYKERSSAVNVDIPRGAYEPSLVLFKNEMYMTLRNDEFGIVARFKDSSWQTKKWCWDNGEAVETYNTQSHWLTVKDKLYLVYTRKAGFNDHVFRHRAPLFISEVSTDNLTLIRSTEKIAVVEKGARLGNFGVCSITENKAAVTVGEWMQPAGCEKYGSNNDVYISVIEGD